METSIEKRVAELENLVFLSKNVLSFDEASKFLNLSKSYLYKLTSGTADASLINAPEGIGTATIDLGEVTESIASYIGLFDRCLKGSISGQMSDADVEKAWLARFRK